MSDTHVWGNTSSLPHTDIARAATAKPVGYRDGVIVAVEMTMYCPRGKHEATMLVESGRFTCQSCKAIYTV